MDYRNELNKFIEYVLEKELPGEKSWVYAKELKQRLFLEQVSFGHKEIVKTIIEMVENEASNDDILTWMRNNKDIDYTETGMLTTITRIREVFGW